jgi:hypothetical protein
MERATGWVMAALGTIQVPGHVDIVEGPAAAVLVERSRRAALLVVGAQAHQRPGRLVVGSISHYCLSHAACPVVAVPSPAPDGGAAWVAQPWSGRSPERDWTVP